MQRGEVVYHRRRLSALYYVFVATFILLGVLLLMAALGNAVENGAWSEKWLSVTGFAVAGLSWLLGAPQMWARAKSYASNEVRVGDSQFSLHTPAGDDIQFALREVRQVWWNPGMRSRLCTVVTDGATYFFDTRSCPRPAHVAELIAERSGKPLQLEE